MPAGTAMAIVCWMDQPVAAFKRQYDSTEVSIAC